MDIICTWEVIVKEGWPEFPVLKLTCKAQYFRQELLLMSAFHLEVNLKTHLSLVRQQQTSFLFLNIYISGVYQSENRTKFF